MAEIEKPIVWRSFHDSQSGRFIGVCDSLQLTVEAQDLPELRESITEAEMVVLKNASRSTQA